MPNAPLGSRQSLSRRVVAEFLGTALLLAAVVGSGIMGEELSGGNVALALLANTLATGAALGGATGLLAALASLAIPGVGPIIAGGVLGTTLAGAGIGAAAGGLIGALTSLGLSEEDARYYEEGIRSGGTLVTVHDNARTADAVRVLEQFGGRTR